ncbi:interleukin-7 receptor subunit alpha [Sphaerodactylus townsendi]|uniref:interleukin-7 receptor subunit alpha n=1 Tax=Sphaerodactylus townsendi TaxID=933632 RepID=UPI002025F366|nr:interleukin-7 receptor subunit alpha [Sphaerodactylus townsendi]
MEMYLKETLMNFTVRAGDNVHACSGESQLGWKCSVKSSAIYYPVEACLIMEKLQYPCCKKLTLLHIVKPEAPFGLTITDQDKEEAYLVQFSNPLSSQTYLKDKLLYEIAYWPANTNWTVNNNTKVFQHVPLRLLRQEFQPSTKYELKVQSKPNEVFFKGMWSEWSSSAFIQTAPRMQKDTNTPVHRGNKIILMTTSFVGFFILLIIISLIPIFWKSRIKPVVWPAIPNHKKMLDKLCNTLRKNSEISFFNPESLGYAHIHKVDSIQAKSEMEHSQQLLLPFAVDVPETVRNGPELKRNLSHVNDGWLKLSLAYEGMWPAELLNRHLGTSNHLNSDEFIRAICCNENGASDQHGRSDALSAHSSALLGPTILPGLESCPADPLHPAYANSEIKVSNKEEVYVTMASFFKSKGNLGNRM